MTPPAPSSRASVFPFLRYQDSRAAIAWLERAFGFTPRMVHDGPAGTVAHAELQCGAGIVMLGDALEGGLDMQPPGKLGGSSQGVYLWCADAKGMWQRARAAGAEVIRPLATTSYGAEEFTVRDPEGHLWSFGTYHPDDEG